MDGVLIDSEGYWESVDEQFFALNHIEWPPETVAQLTGMSEADAVDLVKKTTDSTLTKEEMRKQRDMLSENIYTTKCQPMKGVDRLLEEVRSAGVPTAIVSSTVLRRIQIVVERFGWAAFFDHLISAESVGLPGKPNPAVYTYAAQMLGLEPSDCVVIEDSVNGLKAAKGAGMQCIAVPEAPYERERYATADLIVESLEDPAIKQYIGL